MSSKEMNDFLWFSYFGITPSEAVAHKDKAINKCIDRAYRDLNRTIEYTYSQSVLDKKSDKTLTQDARKEYIEAKQDIKNTLSGEIHKAINQLLNSSTCQFKEWHKMICNTIIDYNPKVEDLNVNVLKKNMTYGQAQKWVNMTLKYTWLMGLIEDENIQKQLCVPIDNYILKIVKELHGKEMDSFEITKDGDTYKVKPKNKETAYPWSKIPDACFYYGLNDEIKEIIGDDYPLVWENEAWIKSSQSDESEKS